MILIHLIKVAVACGFVFVGWFHSPQIVTEETNFELKQNSTEDIINLKDKLHPYN